MEFKTLKHEQNPFLHREEYIIEIKSNSNPNFSDVKQKLGKNENLTIVKSIRGNFGRKTFNAEVVVYDSEKHKNEVETIPKKIRKKLEEERKKAEEEKAKAEEEAKKAEEEKKQEETKTYTEEKIKEEKQENGN